MSVSVGEKVDDQRGEGEEERKTSPLIPVGLAIMAVLLVPVLMYSAGPEGPIKNGDVVFSTGQHRVYFEESQAYAAFGYPGYCTLNSREQLLVRESAGIRSDGTFIAQPLGDHLREFPACPSSAKLILHAHQITLKTDMLGSLRDSLAKLFPVE